MADAVGAVAVSVTLYPVTPTLSVAAKDVIDTVRVLEVAGMVNAEMVGFVVSPVDGGGVETVIVTEALRLVETFPAASLAQA